MLRKQRELQIMPGDHDVDLQSGAGSQQLIQVVRRPDLRQADKFVAIRNGVAEATLIAADQEILILEMLQRVND